VTVVQQAYHHIANNKCTVSSIVYLQPAVAVVDRILIAAFRTTKVKVIDTDIKFVIGKSSV
jgi:hypothetical protein